MRLLLIPAALAVAAPAAAAERAAPTLPPELTDPKTAEALGRMTAALARAMMELPVGELEAAIENRPATPADRARRVRDVAGDPGLEQRVGAQGEAAGRTMQAASQALVAALPALVKALDGVEAELERAVANLPDPTYPKR